MTTYARVRDGHVVEIVTLPEGFSIADVLHPDIVKDIHPCSPDVRGGWAYDGEQFSPPPPSAAPSAADLIAYTADRRWRAEQGGTIWNGWPIHTDDRSQGKYLSELQAIALGVRVDGDPWKFADGLFRPVSNTDFPQLAIAAREHVRTAFGIEGAVLVQIEAGAITTREQIDAAFSSV